MKGMKRTTRGIGKVILALLGGVLIPVLIWMAFGIAVTQRVRGKEPQRKAASTIGEILTAAGLTIQEDVPAGQAVAAKTFRQRPASEIREILARAGLIIHDEAVTATASKQILPARTKAVRV